MPKPTIEPYAHDCPQCIWAGWLTHEVNGEKRYANVWFCPNDGLLNRDRLGTIILRYSSEPGDYRSWPVMRGAKPHTTTVFEEPAHAWTDESQIDLAELLADLDENDAP